MTGIFLIILGALICSAEGAMERSTNVIHKGCFREYNAIDSKRLLPGNGFTDDVFLTRSKCDQYCMSMGYIYSGVQFSKVCFCGTLSDAEWSRKVDGSECNMLCPGRLHEKCGGRDRMNIMHAKFKTIPPGQYLGCFSDFNPEELLTGVGGHFPLTNSPDSCRYRCALRGYRDAGLEDGSKCVCGALTDEALINKKLDESRCNIDCPGQTGVNMYAKPDACGGESTMNVYRTDFNSTIPTYRSEYMGCFDQHNGTNVLFDVSRYAVRADFLDFTTRQMCMNHCAVLGFDYAGLQSGHECFCNQIFEEKAVREVDESNCIVPCHGNPLETCGGFNKLSVFRLNIERTDGYVGCFHDQSPPGRLIPDHTAVWPQTNSPEKCRNYCKSSGYAYAGVQFGKECFCGDLRKVAENRRVGERNCNYECPGHHDLYCGGWMTMIVYQTGNATHSAHDYDSLEDSEEIC